jgi:hypothetical protein
MRVYFPSCLIAVAVALFAGRAQARADEMYYLVLFAYEGVTGAPQDAHSFAAFVKADGKPGKAKLTVSCISWLPVGADVKLLKRPEAGVNLSLEKTLRLAAERKARVAAFGPYRIKKELYDRALAQIDRLNSGTVAYKALDKRFRSDAAAVNCFHAISDMIDGPLLDTGTAFGRQATAMVRDHLAKWIMNDRAPQPWLIEPLGLKREGISFVE